MSDKQQQWVKEVTDALGESLKRDEQIIDAITLFGKMVIEQSERISNLESLVEMLLESHDKYQHGDN